MIKKLEEIDFSSPNLISFEGTVINILSEGDGDKKPIKFNIKLEESGELVSVSTWKHENLQDLKRLVFSDEVYVFEGQAGNYGTFGNQIRVGSIRNSGKRSVRKILKTVDSQAVKNEIKNLINTYITRDSIYYKLLDKLVMNNDKFWIWPAATKVHHAYNGGLAKHSLNVCKNAIDIWKTYEGSNLNIQLLVAGALLHDLGKIKEYNQDTSRTIYGNFIPHIVEGYREVAIAAHELGVSESDIQLVVLEHTILSHHGKYEFGSPVVPYIAEAVIISKADDLDAVYDSIDSSLDNLEKGNESDRLMTIESKIFKWNN